MESLKEIGNCLSHEIDPGEENKSENSGSFNDRENDLEVTRVLRNANIFSDTRSRTRIYDTDEATTPENWQDSFSAHFKPIPASELDAEMVTPTKELEEKEETPPAPLKRQDAVLEFRQTLPEETFHTPSGGRTESNNSSLVFERTVNKDDKPTSPMPFPGGMKEYDKYMQRFWNPAPEDMSTPVKEKNKSNYDVCGSGAPSHASKKSDN